VANDSEAIRLALRESAERRRRRSAVRAESGARSWSCTPFELVLHPSSVRSGRRIEYVNVDRAATAFLVVETTRDGRGSERRAGRLAERALS